MKPALPYHERITDPTFRRAVDLIDAGDAAALAALLRQNPDLIRQRVAFEGDAYFQNPSLLEFVAENPVRYGRLPENILAVTRTLLDAKPERRSLNDTLLLVASGRVARESGMKIPLLELLCSAGADPDVALHAAASHGEFDAVKALLRLGAKPDLAVLAALGEKKEFGAKLAGASPEQRHLALAFAAQFGHAEIVQALLDTGEDPDRFNPQDANGHSTPLHQAAFAGHLDVVKLLAERGAKLEVRDTLWNGTPEDWARNAGKTDVAGYLERLRSGAKR
jgi:peptide-methionine (S)-S-oxide reductase